MTDSRQWLIGPLVITVLRLLYFEAATERVRRTGRGLVFPVSIPARGALLLTAVGSAVGVLLSYSNDPWIAAICLVFLVASAIWWPPTIVLSDETIAQRFWWGRTKRIGWQEVSGADRDANGHIIVHGTSGININFSSYHVDRRRFEAELAKRAHITRIGRYEDVPSLRI
jgi:hypothetical protein